MVPFVDHHAPRLDELSRLTAVTPPLVKKLPVGREFLDAIVVAVLADVVIAARILDGIGHEIKVPRLVAVDAADSAVLEKFTGGGVDECAEVVSVRDQQIAVPIDR
jgi:hypothetical protein